MDAFSCSAVAGCVRPLARILLFARTSGQLSPEQSCSLTGPAADQRGQAQSDESAVRRIQRLGQVGTEHPCRVCRDYVDVSHAWQSECTHLLSKPDDSTASSAASGEYAM